MAQARLCSNLSNNHQTDANVNTDAPISTYVNPAYQSALKVVLGTRDISALLAFADNGLYCAGTPGPTFAPEGDDVLIALRIYVTSVELEGNGRYAMPGPSFATVQDFQKNTCDDGTLFSEGGFCDINS